VSDAVLLDTCASIWLMNGDPMSRESREAIRRGQMQGVYVSPITAWEIGILAARGKLQLTLSPEAWFDELLSLDGVRLADLPPKVLFDSSFLPGKAPRDAADRILAATARFHGYSMITRDRALVEYGREGHLKVIAC
jgi:PIN domain nuclease of toxin-antitoxin system